MRDLAKMQAETPMDMLQLEGLILDGLSTDGGHHKQWYLHQIAKILCIDYDANEYDSGIPG